MGQHGISRWSRTGAPLLSVVCCPLSLAFHMPHEPTYFGIGIGMPNPQKNHAPREQPKIKLREAKFLRANLIRPRQLPRFRPMATGHLRPYSASRPALQLEWGVASARTAALCYTALVAILRELHAAGSVSQLTDRLSYLSARLHGRPIVRRLSIKRERKATEMN